MSSMRNIDPGRPAMLLELAIAGQPLIDIPGRRPATGERVTGMAYAIRQAGDQLPPLVAVAAQAVREGALVWGVVDGEEGIRLWRQAAVADADAFPASSPGQIRINVSDPEEGPTFILCHANQLVLVER